MVFNKSSLVLILSPGIGKVNNQAKFLLALTSYWIIIPILWQHNSRVYLNMQAFIQLIINISKVCQEWIISICTYLTKSTFS